MSAADSDTEKFLSEMTKAFGTGTNRLRMPALQVCDFKA